MELVFVFQKETKGAVQYKECDSSANHKTIADSIIGTLYVRKSAIKTKSIPMRIRVNVTGLEE